MSGGFFRGTSADQDTRFSNKQAKLLKSQKFAPELDQLVDMTKVKMDVIRPWIATRATELLGFEDEVLINFVYGLLDGKEVDGKQIQIQLTGFMEKNTGKFMKELWGLLISAQNNVSGVPQQLLDAKEEETRKKKVETDRIAQEIQKRRDRDGKEPDRERKSRFDGETYISGFTGASSDQVSKFSKPRLSSIEPEVDIEEEGKHGSRAKNGSPPPKDHSQSPPRKTVPSPARSESKSLSRSRSYSEDRHKSTSRSISSQSPRRSVSPAQHSQSPPARPISPRKRYRSPPRRSISPRRRRQSPRDTRSPLRRRSPYRRRRSSSRSRYRSPPPIRYRSPRRRRSPVRRRSPSPVRRRSPSPVHRRSPSPARRRSPSPLYRRSPSPWHRRSPGKARRRSPSPIRRRSPIRQRSISPKRRRSPSLLRRSPPPRSPKLRRRSPLHSPKNRSANSPNSPRQRKRSRSPYRSQSPSRRTRRSLSRERDSRMNGNEYSRHRDGQTSQRFDAKKSPERDVSERPGSRHKASESLPHKMPISLRSPQRDIMNRPEERNKVPVASPENSSRQSDSPTDMPKINSRINRRSRSFSRSPIGRASYRAPRHDSPVTNLEEANNAREVTRHRADSSRRRNRDSSKDVGLKKAYANNHSPKSYSPDKRASNQSPVAHGRRVQSEVKKDSGPLPKSNVVLPERRVEHLPYSSEEHEYNPASVIEERGAPRGGNDKERSSKLLKKDDSSLDGRKYTEQIVDGERREKKIGDEFIESHQEMLFMNRSKKETSKKDRQDKDNSDSEETDLYQNQSGEKHRHKKSDKRKRDSDESSGSDSQIEDKKEAKRRRKDEKRLRKEERRRRREERHRRKLERRAGKLKSKYIDTVNPTSDFEKDHSDSGDSDGGNTGSRKKFHPNDADDIVSDPKKLEIELREKALESLRAKKAISH